MASTLDLGDNIRTARRNRRMTQQILAERAGVSVDLVGKLEQGQRSTARLDSLGKIAVALDMTLGELLGKAKGLAVGAENGEVLGLRRAILGIATPAVEPQPVPLLQARLVDLWELYWHGRYAVLSRELPAQIESARSAAQNADGRDRNQSRTVLAETLQLTASLLTHLAVEDLAQLALAGALTSADQAEDPLLVASMQANSRLGPHPAGPVERSRNGRGHDRRSGRTATVLGDSRPGRGVGRTAALHRSRAHPRRPPR